MKIAHVNARSLCSNFISFKDYFCEFQLDNDIIAVTETSPRPNVSDDMIALGEIQVIMEDRDGRGGGICLTIENLWDYFGWLS